MLGPGCAEVAAATIDTLIVTEIHKNFYIKYNIRKIIIIGKYKNKPNDPHKKTRRICRVYGSIFPALSLEGYCLHIKEFTLWLSYGKYFVM